jgi:hypothetical protein
MRPKLNITAVVPLITGLVAMASLGILMFFIGRASNDQMLEHLGRIKGTNSWIRRATTPFVISIVHGGKNGTQITVPQFSIRQLSSQLYDIPNMTWSANYRQRMHLPRERVVVVLPATMPTPQGKYQHCIAMLIELDGEAHFEAYPINNTNCDLKGAPTDPIDSEEDIILAEDFTFFYKDA